jgi:NAD(P)-dependent dehydrogenase (short-subunit alcohol dehydrogenase family)
MRLKGKTAIVTGAGKGIGRGIAEEFAAQGATVVIATKEAEGELAAEEIRRRNGQALFIQTDVSVESDIRRMADFTLDQCGRIDVLVNNAGITVFKPLLEATVEDWDRLMNVDLRGVFLCCKHVIPAMMKQGGGSIINISSGHAIATLPDTEMYAAAKAGVNGMTRSMALSFGPHGIRVNAICPGFTDTPHLHNWLSGFDRPELAEREMLDLHPLGKIAAPADIARLAVYLASDESELMTGSILVLDGGVHARLYNSKII